MPSMSSKSHSTTTPSATCNSKEATTLHTMLQPGRVRNLPSHYTRMMTEEADKEENSFLGLRLEPCKVSPRLQDFLELCERRSALIPYDQVLYDANLQDFVDDQGVTDFLVMMYKFLDVGELSTEKFVRLNWADYLVVFLNRDGMLCEFQFDNGGKVHPIKWEYKQDCYLEANERLGEGLFRFS